MSSLEFFVLLGSVLFVDVILLVVSYLGTQIFNWLLVGRFAWFKHKVRFPIVLSFFATVYLILTVTQWNFNVAYSRSQVLTSIVPVLVLFLGFTAFRIYFPKHQGQVGS